MSSSAPSVPYHSNLGRLSRFEARIVARLYKGGRLSRQPSGHAKLGPLNVPASLLLRLEQADLLCWSDDKGKLSDAGRHFARRLNDRTKESDGTGDAFTRQHQDLQTQTIEQGGRKEKVIVNRAESPLWWLKSRRGKDGAPLITDLQFAAGERLRQDWDMAHLGPRLGMSWDATPASRTRRGPSSMPDLPPGALRAKQRLEAALEHCGNGLGDILVRVCCQHEGLTEAEAAMGWPRRSAKLILGFGLERLVEFYGLHAGRTPQPS